MGRRGPGHLSLCHLAAAWRAREVHAAVNAHTGKSLV